MKDLTPEIIKSLGDLSIGFLGCGQMGSAILSGLLNQALVSRSSLFVSARISARDTAEHYGVTALSPVELLKRCELIILGIKPYQLHLTTEWIREALPAWRERPSPPCLLSMLAGTSFQQLRDHIGDCPSLIRMMPNLPLQVGAGVTLICGETEANTWHQSSVWLERTSQLLSPLGLVERLDQESDFHAATAISGCGPAYLFHVIEALADGGVHQGLKRELALRLAAQTVLGSGALAHKEHPAVLKDRVTSPGGVTIAGIRVLERSGIRSAMIEAVIEASEKSKAMERSR